MKPGNQLYTTMYDADSRRTTMMLGNGTTRKYQFDNRGQLTTQIELSGATPLFTIVDGYDPVGNRITRNLDGNPITWTYDDLYRLTGQAKAGQVCTYTLDGVGNLLTMWEGGNFPKTFTFNAADRLVTMMEGANLTTYAYTGYGALESEITGNSTTAYAYSGQDQLILVTPPSGFKSTYTFDGDGLRRTAQEGNVQPTTMVWDGSDYLLLNEPGANRVVLTLENEIVACGNKDLLTDPLGSLVKEISAGASLSGLFEFWPYGTARGSNPRQSTPYGYVAAYGYYNDDANRDYVRARELMKKLGRWMQTDPLWPSERAYGYVNAKPTIGVDYTGAFGCTPNPCSKLTSPAGICIAMLCSLAAAKDIIDLLKDLLGSDWESIVKGIISGGGDWKPSASPEDCCKEASGGGQAGPLPNVISVLIGIVCRKFSAGEKPCWVMMRTKRGCAKCCGIQFPKPNSLYERCMSLCRKRWDDDTLTGDGY